MNNNTDTLTEEAMIEAMAVLVPIGIAGIFGILALIAWTFVALPTTKLPSKGGRMTMSYGCYAFGKFCIGVIVFFMAAVMIYSMMKTKPTSFDTMGQYKDETTWEDVWK